MKVFGIMFLLMLFGAGFVSNSYAEDIPSWVKNNAKWWAEGMISEDDFVLGLGFLIKNDILQVPPTGVTEEKSDEIPDWVKNNALWWGQDKISDNDFLNGIQFLISVGIISVKGEAHSGLPEDIPMNLGTFDLSKAGPFEGKTDAPFTIIMFSDHQCEKCSQWVTHEKQILKKQIIEPGKAKFFLLDYPFLGEDSTLAAEATYCAEDQGKFQEYQEILAAKHNGLQTGWANHDSLVSYAVDLGLDAEKFDQCLFWDRHSLRVDHNKDVAFAHGVVSTPVFFLIFPDETFERINGPQPPMVFEALINEWE